VGFDAAVAFAVSPTEEFNFPTWAHNAKIGPVRLVGVGLINFIQPKDLVAQAALFD